MKNIIKNGKYPFKIYKNEKIILILIYCFIYIEFYLNFKNGIDIKVALCTMGKMENLYINEFVDYYYKLGIDHIFIYDDNEDGTEKMSDALDNKHKKFITINKAKLFHINNQSTAFSNCYKNNIDKFDWFLMVDMDEFLFIVNNTLKGYLTNKEFDKCDFIKFHWVITTDNNLIYYDKRPLFERFKPPYIKKQFIKSINIFSIALSKSGGLGINIKSFCFINSYIILIFFVNDISNFIHFRFIIVKNK